MLRPTRLGPRAAGSDDRPSDLQLVTKNEDLDLALSALLARWH